MVDNECIISKLEQLFEPWAIQSFLDALPWVDKKFLCKETIGSIADEITNYLKSVTYGEDAVSEFADANTAVNTRDLCEWYSKDPRRFSYANDWIKNNGYPHESGTEHVLRLGQFSCLETFAGVIADIIIDEDMKKGSHED
ncbi:MAG: hypothetical protein QXU18_08740 [Thermoplasmatales archaeon]